jgi:hypothetical protein
MDIRKTCFDRNKNCMPRTSKQYHGPRSSTYTGPHGRKMKQTSLSQEEFAGSDVQEALKQKIADVTFAAARKGAFTIGQAHLNEALAKISDTQCTFGDLLR